MKLYKLREAIEHSWAKDTTYCINTFSKKNPSEGQCLVSALIIQDWFQGRILEGRVYSKTNKFLGYHYWNNMYGFDIDITWQQFPPNSRIKYVKIQKRDSLLEHEHVAKRYGILQQKVYKYLKS